MIPTKKLKVSSIIDIGSSRNGVSTGLDAETDWQKIVEPITAFKSMLDCALNADHRSIEEDSKMEYLESWRKQHGFEKAPSGRGVGGRTMIHWILGPYWRFGSSFQLCHVPAWMCIGWNRKQRAPISQSDATKIISTLDSDTIKGVDECATGEWFAPLPFVCMGEGQNRVDLHRVHNLPLLIRLRTANLAPAATLQMQRVLGRDDLLALKCLDKNFHHPSGEAAILPFPDLARPLLTAYGVPFISGRFVLTPLHSELRQYGRTLGDIDLSWFGKMNPENWRKMMLSQAYV